MGTGEARQALVSIHAPAGGATVCTHHNKKQPCFNPRARGGRDGPHTHTKGGRSRFNPRARGGRDEYIKAVISRYRVSIHAPAGGATFAFVFCTYTLNCFNPRARGGRDSQADNTVDLPYMFQSTRPRGARREAPSKILQSSFVSIHAPAGGATLAAILSHKKIFVSIHAPAGGARLRPLQRPRLGVWVSIHAPAGGATVINAASDFY